uniref:J domain-containing protein n=1 Tax=Calcidiscus leptoporus TaxID=127549 RepID=A0A7S0IP03_9EUKA|mmetsp:Transcript_14065/g.32055  ORF Transcript_14065/g.32055 Transcript_14065/m.32055 type:complete len:139 (+) Transcript_14065:6-422(+)
MMQAMASVAFMKGRIRGLCSEPLRLLLDLPAGATHDDLRAAYLRAVMHHHPDCTTSTSSKADAAPFLALQAAWERYEKSTRAALSCGGPGTFTKFGVGCSFTDSEEEQLARREVTELASRGHLPRTALPGPTIPTSPD